MDVDIAVSLGAVLWVGMEGFSDEDGGVDWVGKGRTVLWNSRRERRLTGSFLGRWARWGLWIWISSLRMDWV